MLDRFLRSSVLLLGAVLLSSFAWLPNPAMPDFEHIRDSQQRKQQFFAFLLPIVLQENAAILQQRMAIERWIGQLQQATEKPPSQALSSRVRRIALVYGYQGGFHSVDELTQLLQRVDIIPPSLVLAQAANESAWGTSRFARLGNNLFGQWCFRVGCGITPKLRSAQASHEVRSFASVNASVRAYLHNLNRHASYETLRQIRATARQRSLPLLGEQLAQGLMRYSQRGQDYIDEIRLLIQQNELQRYDFLLLPAYRLGNRTAVF